MLKIISESITFMNHEFSTESSKRNISPVLQQICVQCEVPYNSETCIVHNWIRYVTEIVEKKQPAKTPVKLPQP